MKKMFMLLTSILFLVLSVNYVSACGYQNHGDCEITKTIVEGRVYYADTNQSAGNANVTVECNHNGTISTRNTHSVNFGFLKGTYFVLFPQNQCISGDDVTVSATKDGLSGEEEGTIKNWITKRCLDIDIGIVNVPLIPEFGLAIGVLTLVGAVSIFFFVRRR